MKPRTPRDDRRGSALLVTMLAAVLLSGLSGALLVVLTTEEAVEANHRRGVVALYAADGLLEGVMAELADLPDWHAVLDGSRRSVFDTGLSQIRLADGFLLDLRRETRDLQRETDLAGGAGALRWRLYASIWFADLLGEADPVRIVYVAAWVGDDRADPDADPEHDANGRIAVRAAAFGPFRARRAVDATVGRVSGVVRRVAWALVR